MTTKNMGGLDKSLRIALGAALILGALLGYGTWMWIGIVPLVTGLLNSCPIYSVLGISTCPTKKN
ncbi:DUF2892 domain-containing protein [Ruegeria sp. HKCCD6604]|uniref:YgaP family membrane protein n=1 Tax=Ruegeria sp. HKCCD6604 TaxID=2683000 RepID=UPI0035300473